MSNNCQTLDEREENLVSSSAYSLHSGLNISTVFEIALCTVQNSKRIIICSLSVLCSPRLILTRSPQISGQNKSEAKEPEGLVKITYGIVASSLFKRAGNSN